ncbi:dockerin type I domain-containing protein [Halogeometricum borinquense]|uniref:Dockerin-like protein n=2 Tax=Halogeometricum borinquense (strain ATCC 700274 / DSM 11551 / JCM 10706 / KCTC 4070 / PR3) TaxID=469382 RepID=E4NUE8_HALBP|nr:dockerin type I domain-containing protein [Halogeometricum borinquense]ADQ68668.1 dockerin-like protein [Halogeometricum borinquense DSM 11551]
MSIRRTTEVIQMKQTFTAVTAALLVLAPIALAIGPGAVAAQQDPYTVEVVAPDDFSTNGNQTLTVRVTNNADDAFLNPVVEVPISSPLSLPAGATDTVYADGDPSNTREAAVQDSTFQTGDALVISGANIDAGETRTYHFNVTVDTPGSTTVSADVRPLYNTDQNVRASTSMTALGTGTVSANVVDTDGNAVSNADVSIDGNAVGSSVSETVLEGEHTVSVSGLDGDYPSFTFDTAVGGDNSVTFVKQDEKTIQPIAYTSDETNIVVSSTSRTEGSAVSPVNTTVSFTFSKDSGTAVYEVQEPSVATKGDGTVSTDGNLVSESMVDGDKRLEIKPTGATTQVDLEYEGYELGNVNRDDTVDATDASAVSADVAKGQSPEYADVNDDGRVSAIDAMFIAQYAADNRTPDYSGVQ